MDSKKALKISLGIGLGVSILGLFYYVTRKSPLTERSPISQVPRAASSPGLHSEAIKNLIEPKPELNTEKKAALPLDSKVSKGSEVPECEISQEDEKPKKDEFMEGMLADAEDDSGVAWGGDDAGEAAAFEKQAKAFRSIANELSEKNIEKHPAKTLKKQCIAKK